MSKSAAVFLMAMACDAIGCGLLTCEQYDRSIDVFSDYLKLEGLKDVSIDTAAPYAITVSAYNDVTLWVGSGDGVWGAEFCTGYNGFQSSHCDSSRNVPEAIQRNYWNGGAQPGAGSVGWGGCKKCETCYVSSDMFGQMSCDYLCDGYDWNDPNVILTNMSSGTNAKNGVIVGLLCLAVTSLSLFFGA